MNCSEFQQQLSESLDRHGLSPAEASHFARHVDECANANCAELWGQYRLLTAAIDRWQRSVPSVDVADRVLGELRTPVDPTVAGLHVSSRAGAMARAAGEPSPPRTTSPRGRSWGAVATMAAALLAGVSLLTLNQPSGTEPPGAETASHESMEPPAPLPLVAENDETSADLRQSPTIGETYASMPLSATEFMTDAVVFVVPADLRDPDDEPSRADLWADRLEEQLEPIGRELSSAFESIMRALPSKRPSST